MLFGRDLLSGLFSNLAYNYYPKHVTHYDNFQEYEASSEYLKLSRLCDFYHSQKISTKFHHTISRHIREVEIYDTTLLHWKERCMRFPIIIGSNKKEITTLLLYVSVLIPYYTYVLLEAEKVLDTGFLNPAERKPLRLGSKAFDTKTKIDAILRKLYYQEFPEFLIENTVADIGFKDIPIGSFTIFNAFFADDYEAHI